MIDPKELSSLIDLWETKHLCAARIIRDTKGGESLPKQFMETIKSLCPQCVAIAKIRVMIEASHSMCTAELFPYG